MIWVVNGNGIFINKRVEVSLKSDEKSKSAILNICKGMLWVKSEV